MKFIYIFLFRIDNFLNMLTAFIIIFFILLFIQRLDVSLFFCKKKYYKQLEFLYEIFLIIWFLLSLKVFQKLIVNYCLCCNIYFYRFSNCNIIVFCVIILVYRYVFSLIFVKFIFVDSVYIYNIDILYLFFDCWINFCFQKKKYYFFMVSIICLV